MNLTPRMLANLANHQSMLCFSSQQEPKEVIHQVTIRGEHPDIISEHCDIALFSDVDEETTMPPCKRHLPEVQDEGKNETWDDIHK
jgi:hypothetical protein